MEYHMKRKNFGPCGELNHQLIHSSIFECEDFMWIFKATFKGLTGDRRAGRPRRNGIPPLIEEDVGFPSTHLSLGNCFSTAVIVTIPVAIHRVPTEGYTKDSFLIALLKMCMSCIIWCSFPKMQINNPNKLWMLWLSFCFIQANGL